MKPFNTNYYRLPFLLLSLLITIFFAWTYAASPFAETINSLILNGGTVLSALVAAVMFTLIPSYFRRGEPPRIIWIFFAISMWLWTIAEAIWAYLYMRDGEVPVFTIADVFWMLGYIALTIALTRQFRLVSFSQTRSAAWAALVIWVGILVLIAIILIATHSQMPIEDFFSYFYLLADGVLGLVALYLVYAFRVQALAIPWLTISSFVFSDFIYIRLTQSGVYDYVMSGVSIALVADTLYLAAYLLVAWGGLEQYLLLRSNSNHSKG